MIGSQFIYVAFVLSLLGKLSYLIETIRGKNRPNKVTWSLWTLMTCITLVAQIAKGAGISALLTAATFIGATTILCASFINPNARWALTRFDVICGALSLLGLALWGITREGNLAIAASIAANALAGIPTVKKSFYQPYSESPWNYLVGFISGLLTLSTFNSWSFSSSIYAIYVTLMSGVVAGIILTRRGELGRPQAILAGSLQSEAKIA